MLVASEDTLAMVDFYLLPSPFASMSLLKLKSRNLIDSYQRISFEPVVKRLKQP